MNLNWSNKVIKYVLFVFNLLFVISGIIMIAVGVSVKEYYTSYDIFLSSRYFSLPNLLIAIGSLIFFISFFGCCGAIRESWLMIFVFSILLSLIFIMEFAAGIAGYVLRDDTASFLEDSLTASMNKYDFNKDTVSSETKLWDLIQKEFKCCGVNDPRDWTKIYPPNSSTVTPIPSTLSSTVTPIPSTPPSRPPTSTQTSVVTVTTTVTTTTNSSKIRKRRNVESEGKANAGDLPFSCCEYKSGSAGDVSCNLNNNATASYYKKGCVKGFGDYVKEHAVTIGGVGIAIALIQLFGVIFACHLTRQLKNGFYST